MTFLTKFSKQITSSSDDSQDAITLLDWQVNSEICTLRNLKSDTEVRINPRGMEVLMYLIEHPNNVISTSELLDLFWSKSVRSDHAVHNVIAELRSALGDQASKPPYIKTYPKRGYCLLTKPVSANIGHEEKPNEQNRASTHSFFPIHLLRFTALFLFFSVGVLALFFSNDFFKRQKPESPAQRTLLVQPFETINLAPNAIYLSKQLPGSLVLRLSKLPNAQVILSQGDFLQQDNVDYLLSGNIQQINGEHRLQVNLSDAKSNAILFSDQFMFRSKDIFNIQDDIVQHVAIALRIYLDDEMRNDMIDWGTREPLNNSDISLAFRQSC